MMRVSSLLLLLLLGVLSCAASGADASDLSVAFSSSAARAATHAVGGLLNSGPEYGSALLAPLRLGSFRGKHCLEGYDALAEAGAATIACSAAEEFSYLVVNGSTTARGGPGADGDWASWDATLDALVRIKRAWKLDRLALTIWNEPNNGFWNGTFAEYLELWRRTVLRLRANDPTITILGPTIDRFDLDYLGAFVDFTVKNGVVPDVLDWHAWGGVGGAMGPDRSACPCLYPPSLPCACGASVGNGSDVSAQHAATRAWLRTHHPDLVAIPIGHSEMVPMNARLFAGLTLGALAGLERAGAVFGAHSNWGEPLLNLTTCGFCELITCDDQAPPRAPRATYQVYAAYGNTSGVMAPVTRRCDDCDAFASYDGESESAWLAVGRYDFRSAAPRTVTLRATGVPPALVADGRVAVDLARIPNSLQYAVPAPTPMGATTLAARPSAAVAGAFDVDLAFDIEPHDVWTARLTRPPAASPAV